MIKFKGYLYNVGPSPIDGDKYSGVHSYSQVLFPFINECQRKGIEFTWGGDTIKNSVNNKFVDKLIQEKKIDIPKVTRCNIQERKVSNDLINVDDCDFLFLQPRPQENKIESFIVNNLIDKFVKAEKKVFLFEQDMFYINKKIVDNKFIIHLHPYTKESNLSFKDSRKFMFWYNDYQQNVYGPFLKYDEERFHNLKNKPFDFIYIGNVYGRQESFEKYLFRLETKKNAIFGNWIDNEKKKQFSMRFDNLNFYGSCNHNLTTNLLNAAKFTLQILPEYAANKGLMTARMFNAITAKTLCFVDDKIADAREFVPEELIVFNDWILNRQIEELQNDYVSIMKKRDRMNKKNHVEVRVKEFQKMLQELC